VLLVAAVAGFAAGLCAGPAAAAGLPTLDLVVQSSHQLGVTALRFSPRGGYLVSGGWDRQIKLWSLRRAPHVALLKSFSDMVHPARDLAVTAQEDVLVATLTDGTIRAWRLPGGEPVFDGRAGDRIDLTVHITDDGRFVLLAPWDLSHCRGDQPSTDRAVYEIVRRGGTVALQPSSEASLQAATRWDPARVAHEWSRVCRLQVASRPGGPIYSAAYGRIVALPGKRNLAAGVPDLEGEEREIPGTSHIATGGGVLAVATGDRVLTWSLAAETYRRTLSIRSIRGDRSRLDVTKIAVSPDGRHVAVGFGYAPAARGKHGQGGGSIYLFSTDTGALAATLAAGVQPVHGASFSPDGSSLATVADDGVKVWDLASLRLAYSVGTRDLSPQVDQDRYFVDGVISPDGRGLDLLLRRIPEGGGTVVRFDRAARQVVGTWGTGGTTLGRAMPSPYIVTSVTGSSEGDVLPAPGKHLLMQTRYGAGLIDQIEGTFALSPDGRHLIVSAADLESWDLRRLVPGRRVSSFGDSVPGFSPALVTRADLGNRTSEPIALSGDGARVAAVADGGVRIYEVPGLREVGRVPLDRKAYERIALDGSGERLLIAGTETIQVWQVTGAKLLTTIPVSLDPALQATWRAHGSFGVSRYVRDARFAKSGTQAITIEEIHVRGGREGFLSVRIWNLGARRLVGQLRSRANAPGAVAFSPDGRLMAVPGVHGEIVLWSFEEARVIARLVGFHDDAWLVYDDAGHFDGNRDSGRRLYAVASADFYAVDQTATRMNRPDLLLEAVDPRQRDLIETFRKQHDRRRHQQAATAGTPVQLRLPRARVEAAVLASDHLAVSGSCESEGDPITSFNLFVNGVPALGRLGKRVEPAARVAVREKLPVSSGLNQVELSCTNREGVESFRELAIVHNGVEKPGAFVVVTFGVSSYRNRRLDLRFADRDAETIAETLARAARDSGRYTEVRKVVFTNQRATRAGLAAAAGQLGSLRPDDTLVAFVAGHGVYGPDGVYYFLTHDAAPANLAATAAPIEMLEGLLSTGARRMILMIDTCEAGDRDPLVPVPTLSAFKGAAARPRPSLAGRGVGRVVAGGPRKPASRKAADRAAAAPVDRDRYIFNDVLRRTGAVVISASRADEPSFELAARGHGVFTDETLRALTTPATDVNGDGMASTEELRRHLARAVPAATGGRQNPTIDRDNIHQVVRLPMATGAPERVPGPPQ
jgi:WD40 repeat protein